LKNKRKGEWIKGKNEHVDVFGFLKLISLNLNTYFYHINLKEAKEFLNPRSIILFSTDFGNL